MNLFVYPLRHYMHIEARGLMQSSTYTYMDHLGDFRIGFELLYPPIADALYAENIYRRNTDRCFRRQENPQISRTSYRCSR